MMDFKRNPKTKFQSVDKLDKHAAEQIDALREEIDYHDYLYYAKNSPRISDTTYDKLFKCLQVLNEHFPDLQFPNSPTRWVGARPVDKFKKVKLPQPMLSLNVVEEKSVKVFNDTVGRTADGEPCEYILEPIFDSFSVEIVYQDGR